MPNFTKRGSIWHYSFTIDGRRFRGSSKTADKRLAEDIAHQHETRVRRAAVHGPESVTTFADAVRSYMDSHADTRFLLPLHRHFGKRLLASIKPGDIRDAAMVLYPTAKPATRNRQAITPAQAVINHAADAGLCQKIYVKRFKGEKTIRPVGGKQWLTAFQKHCKKDGKMRLAAFARFLFESGARISEACRLSWDDIDLKNAIAFLGKTKNGESRTIFLTAAMVADIANISDRHPRLVFGYASRHSIAKPLNKAIKDSGLPKLTSHEFGRHAFYTEIIVKNNVDVATAADLGGSKSRRLLLDTYVHGDAVREVVNRVFAAKTSKNKR